MVIHVYNIIKPSNSPDSLLQVKNKISCEFNRWAGMGAGLEKETPKAS